MNVNSGIALGPGARGGWIIVMNGSAPLKLEDEAMARRVYDMLMRAHANGASEARARMREAIGIE